MSSASAAPIPLTSWPTGRDAVLVEIAEPSYARRLGELGLRRGTHLAPVQRTAGGGRVVAAGEARVALDAKVAGALLVTAVPG